MSRRLLCLPLIALLLAAPAFAESAKEHATAARKAEKAKDWKKARAEWDAAYRIEPNAEYLIGMGDAYAKLGDKANAKKQYQAYINDPLALDTDAVKAKIAGLDKTEDLGLDMGGPPAKVAAPVDMGLDLDLSAGPVKKEKPAKKQKGKKAAAVALDDLDLSPAPVAKKVNDLDLAPPPPAKKPEPKAVASLDLAPPPAPAKKPDTKAASAGLDLDLSPPPGPARKPDTKVASGDLDLAPPPGPAKKPGTKVAAASTGLDLEFGPAPKKVEPAKVETKPAQKVATLTPAPVEPVKPPAPVVKKEEPKKTEVAVATTTQPKKKAPDVAVQQPHPPPPAASSGPGTLAWVAAGVAVVGLGGGAFMYSKASSAQSDLHNTSSIKTATQNTDLLNTEKSSKSMSAVLLGVGLAAGLAAGALFAF